MRIPRTIGFRISLGFGLLIIAITLNAVLASRIMSRVKSTQEELSDVFEPGIRQLIELRAVLHHSRDLLQTWDYSGRDAGSTLLNDLRYNLQESIPVIHHKILGISDGWTDRDRESYQEIYKYIKDSISSYTALYTSSLRQNPDQDNTVSAEISSIFRFVDNELSAMIARFDRLAVQASQRTETIHRQSLNILLITGISTAVVAIIIAVLLYLALINPIKEYTETISLMGRGVIPDRKLREGPDEMGRIGTALNNMIRNLRNLADFAEEIGKRNFSSSFTPLSEKDTLGNSLIRLREDLQNAAVEEEKRKREDERRNWSNHGIARFSEILREYSGDQQSLTDKLVSELVNYLGARVGGIFLIRPESEGEIVLVSGYAYDRKKHLKKSIEPREGLVGRCVQEGATIYLTDIPDDYIKIKSGLGEDNPKSLLIVPIRLTEVIIGVIEIASLEIMQDFQIEFVERIGTTIASSLSGELIKK